MFRFVVLVAFCFSASFASVDNNIELGEFSVRAVTQGGELTAIEIFKNKKPFQRIEGVEWWEELRYCDINFLYGNLYGNEDEIGFGYICNATYSAWEYKYDPQEQMFVYAGPMEGLGVSEIKETDRFYVGLDYNHDHERNALRYKSILVFQKPSNKIIQEIRRQTSGLDYTLNGEANVCEGDCLAVGDYNFDGIEDFSLYVTTYSSAGEERNYFLYDPNEERFVVMEFVGEGDTNLQFDYEKKLITSFHKDPATSFSGAFERYLTYKIVDNKMVQVKAECRIIYYGEANDDELTLQHDCDNYGGFSRLSSVGLKKNFELFVALNGDKTKGTAIYRGQKEFLDLSLSGNVAKDFTYNEIYRGKVNGKYIFTIDGYEIKDAYYINNAGKKFKLKPGF
ncbi:MAG: hypothetical protein LBF86_04520 [Helicobacteraceae bacterium]|jgi:hypothetical protein|nr:hypothetical protein [Helicobacteraceae bacterium]